MRLFSAKIALCTGLAVAMSVTAAVTSYRGSQLPLLRMER